MKMTLTREALSSRCCGASASTRLWTTGCTGRCSSVDTTSHCITAHDVAGVWESKHRFIFLSEHFLCCYFSGRVNSDGCVHCNNISSAARMRSPWVSVLDCDTDRCTAKDLTHPYSVKHTALFSARFITCFCFYINSLHTSVAGTHRRHHGDGSSKAPDESVVHRQPTEVWVPVAFRVQSHCQTWRRNQTDRRKRQTQLLKQRS